MKLKSKGETLKNDTIIVESPEEYNKINKALRLYEYANSGNLAKDYAEKMTEFCEPITSEVI